MLFLFSHSYSIGQEVKIADANQKWKASFNRNIESVDRLYHPNAILITEKFDTYVTPESIKAYLVKLKRKMASIVDITSIKTVKGNDNITYEMGRLAMRKKGALKYLVIWNNADGQMRRELEMFVSTAPTILKVTEIDEARKEWMRLCNQHNAYELVKNSYTTDALYYNHKPLVIGTKDISEEYAYMNRPEYSLTLTPIIVEPVNKRIAFEMGQCSGSYHGRYVIVWKKCKGGVWRAIFDSNI